MSPPDDEDLWKRYVEDVDPIKRDLREIDELDKRAKPKNKKKTSDTVIEPVREVQVDLVNVSQPAQIDKRTAMRLKRGQMAIEARIDLHGLYQHEAQNALLAFIKQAFDRNLRCVLVITGKGKLILDGQQREGQPGVIKRNFKSWLAAEPYCSMILKIEKAQIKDGGEGAYYILLRKRR